MGARNGMFGFRTACYHIRCSAFRRFGYGRERETQYAGAMCDRVRKPLRKQPVRAETFGHGAGMAW